MTDHVRWNPKGGVGAAGVVVPLPSASSQVAWEMADSLQRVREEMYTAINDRLDAISRISSAMQGLSAGLAETAKPYKIGDLTPKNWDGSHDKSQFRSFMAELHLWMQTWSDQGERILVRVEGVDKVERSTPAVDCDDNKRTTEDGSTSTGPERI